METQQLHNILESCLLVAGKAMSIAQLENLFDEDIDRPERGDIKNALLSLQAHYEGRGIELVEVSSGWRLQSAASMQHWVGRMFEERPPRYSRALLETLVLIAYRQPITRGEIEDVRGVAVSSNIIRTLQEREWIKEMGFKDVPGKPALWGTTKAFLDYFNLKRLDELPSLAEARDLAEIDAALAAEMGVVDGADENPAANDAQGQDAEAGGDVAGEHVQAEGGIDNHAHSDGDQDNDTGVETEQHMDSSPLNGEQIPGVSTEPDATVQDASSEASELSDSPEATELQDSQVVSGDETLVTQSSDDPELVALAANLGSDNEVTDEPKLGDLVDSVDANTATSDEPELSDLVTKLHNETDVADEPQLADLASDFEAESVQQNESVGLDDSDETADVQATEISALDLDIEQWPERAKDADEGAETIRGEAEADLRKVIDDFAEEHRKQLDERSSHRTNFSNQQSPATDPSLDVSANEEVAEPDSGGDDEHQSASAKLYGVRGSVDAELDPSDSDASEHGENKDAGSSTSSGEP